MTILLTGGNGKTGLKIASLLYNAGIPILVASRSGKAPAPYQAVKFDWLDESTYDACFEGTGVDKIYLVPPPVATDIFEPMRKFIDLAITKGVKRFVFLSGSPWDENSSMSGVVHKYLTNLGVDYCILRPTWFMRESWIFSFYQAILTLPHFQRTFPSRNIITRPSSRIARYTHAGEKELSLGYPQTMSPQLLFVLWSMRRAITPITLSWGQNFCRMIRFVTHSCMRHCIGC